MNYFDPQSAAERYAKGRPDFHDNSIARIKDYLQIDTKIGKALDIACGTGLSTQALLSIATEVHGTDISKEMLHLALQQDKIHYAVASAEQQPFADSNFDLITVCSGIHWFNIDQFLSEANRLLKSRGWLILYENHFISEMEGNENFNQWFPDVYLKNFPSPPRNNGYAWTNENLNPKGFNFAAEMIFKNSIAFNREQLILYFTTQSNIIWAVEKKETSYAQAEDWLNKELSLFFGNEDTIKTINYGNWIKFIQHIN